MDYGKWRFKLSKKEKISRKNQVKIIIKEIQLRPRTDTHDLEIKMRKAKEFLLNGCKVKIHLRYSGREMAHKELGLKMLNTVKEMLLPYAELESDTPKVEKRSVFLFFTPSPAKLKEIQKQKKSSHNKPPAETKAEPKAPAVSPAETKAEPKAPAVSPAETKAEPKAPAVSPAETKAEPKAPAVSPAETKAEPKNLVSSSTPDASEQATDAPATDATTDAPATDAPATDAPTTAQTKEAENPTGDNPTGENK